MTAVILCDGAAASNKAIDLLGAPGLVMPHHEGGQLILAHVFTMAASASSSSTAHDLTQWALQQTSAEALAAAPRRLSGPAVVSTVVATIKENKALRDTLNYKLEMSLMPPPPPPPDGAAQAASPGKKATVKKPDTSKAGRKSQMERDPAALRAAHEAELKSAEEEQRRQAAVVVAYGGSRAAHHHADFIALGVGNVQEGKVVSPGHVCPRALEVLAPHYPLYLIKADGFTLRATTTRVRYVVVAVVADDGEEQGPDRGAGRRAEALASQVAAARLALSRRRPGSQDVVGVAVIVASPAIDAGVVEAHTEALRALLEEQGVEGDEQGGGEGPTGAGEGEGEEGGAAWRPLEVCHLKPTKHTPQPTLDNSIAQVTKFLSQRKCEFLVWPEGSPAVLQEALLALSKPHGIVVPRTWPMAPPFDPEAALPGAPSSELEEGEGLEETEAAAA